MKRARSTSRSLSRQVWQACCLFGLGALTTFGAVGCGEPTTDGDLDPDVTCTAEAVLATNPATGECEWVNACGNTWALCADGFECNELPTDACGIDERCELVGTTVCNDCAGGGGLLPPGEAGDIACGCYDVTSCVEKDPVDPPPTACEQLNEAACVVTAGCEAHFGWIGGPTTDGDRCYGEGCEEPGFMAPPPEDPTWGYLGCFPAQPDGCEGLDEMSCSATPGCAPTYGDGTDCFCAAPAPGDEPVDLPCVCEDPAPGGYTGCVPVDEPPPPTSCYDAWEEGQCWSIPGCEWIYQGQVDGGEGGDPCICPDDDPNCGCTAPGMEAPSYGYCQPQRPDSCYDAYDPYTCQDLGCEWVPSDIWPDPAPCDCDPDDTDCACAGAAPYPETGYCQPPQPQGCWSYGDGMTCESDPACDWEVVEEDLCPPCAPDQPDCECFREVIERCVDAEPHPTTCETIYDEFACLDTPGCGWASWADGDDGSGDRIDPCWDAAYGPDGVCYDGTGQQAPAECCDNAGVPVAPPEGECFTLEPPQDCYTHGDMSSCLADPTCDWGYPTGMDGTGNLIDICSGAHYDAAGQCVNEWGDYVPDCCGQTEPVPPPECFDPTFDPATNTCVNADGTVAPDHCCQMDPPVCETQGWRDQFGNCRGPADEVLPEECCWDDPQPTCLPRQAPGTCEQHTDEFSCSSAGCSWGTVECDCDPMDPACICPAGYCF